MKIRIKIINVSRVDGSVGFTHSDIFDVCSPEENFTRHQNDVGHAIAHMMPNIMASANYDFWRYELVVEKADG